MTLSGALTKTCENCNGVGTIREKREKYLDELTDAQAKTLLFADIYRESGDEETREELEQQKKRAQQQQGSGGPSPRPTNVSARNGSSQNF